MTRTATARRRVVAEIEAWTFFHLGADARLTIDRSESGLAVRFSHQRVHPFEVRFTSAEVERLAADPAALEALLLEELARRRRSG